MQQAQIVQRWLIHGVICTENMCALLMSAGNGNACAQMSQDREIRGEEKCKLTHKNERSRGNLSIDFNGRKRKFRFLYKAWPKVANLHTACCGIEISLPVMICHLENL